MKTLVLNTLGKAVLEQIQTLLPKSGGEMEIVDTTDMKIAHCAGCNQCWLKTPGICMMLNYSEHRLAIRPLMRGSCANT